MPLITRFQNLAAAGLLITLMGCSHLSTEALSLQKPAQAKPTATIAKPSTNPHLLLGNPSNATATVTTPDNYLITRPQYALSYNRNKGIPNWTAWQLNKNWLGSLPRPPFTPDTTLPNGWYQVKPNDYSGSGFDRGHMVPAADRNKTEANSKAVFLMTNIIPQAPDNNQGP